MRRSRAPITGPNAEARPQRLRQSALSAIQSLCVGVAEGRFDRLRYRDDLWRLLVVIAVRKVYDQLERQRRLKRGAGRAVSEAVLAGPDPCGADGFEQFIAEEPSPEFAAMLAEEFQPRLDGLPNEALRRVARCRLEGYSEDDIAERLGCVSRSVRRKLELIRKTWLRDKP